MPSKARPLNNDDLRQSLLNAEAACPRNLPSITADDLLNAARRRRSKSVKTRSTLAAVAIVAATFALVNRSNLPKSPIVQRAGSVSARSNLRAEFAALEREAAIHQQVVRQLTLDREAAEVEAAGAAPIVASLLAAQEASRSAAISLQYATIVEQESPDPERAKQEYERVAQRFPDTPWAALAAASLERLSTHQEHPTL